MSAIPIGFSILNAMTYPLGNFSPIVVPPLYPNKDPLAETQKFIPLQFTYGSTNCWHVSMTGQFNAQTFSAIRGFYIDNSQSIDPIQIASITSGWSFEAPALWAGYTPAIFGASDLDFYVNLNGTLSPATDKTNIFVLNFVPPPSSSPAVQGTLSYGINGPGLSLAPQIAATKAAQLSFYANGAVGGEIIIQYGSGHWYIESIFIVHTNIPVGLNAWTLYDQSSPSDTSSPIISYYMDAITNGPNFQFLPFVGIKYTSKAVNNRLAIYAAGNDGSYVSVNAFTAFIN